jgi:uncharacterized protein (TIGR02001 family)
MNKSQVLLAGAMLVAAGTASAQISVTPALVSDYDFRGISQSAKDPALQLGLNFSHENGFYAGLWGSNVDFGPGDPNLEIDALVGFSGGDSEESFGYDFGATYYTYVGESNFNYPEIYAGISKGVFTGKLWYSWDYANVGESGYYLDGNLSFPLPQDFSLDVHAGYSGGDYWDAAYGDGYFDWSLGVSKSFGNFSVSLKYIDGSDLPDGPSNILSTDSKIWASVSTSLPWSAE